MVHLTKICSVVFVSLITLVSSIANAHQQKLAITKIVFSERTNNIEISHRFYIHDAEHAVKKMMGTKADLINDNKVQSAFADYVVTHFSISFDQSLAVKPKLLGQEVDGKFLWVYQEIPTKKFPRQLTIVADSLMEIWPSQRNIINVQNLGTVKSKILSIESKQGVINL